MLCLFVPYSIHIRYLQVIVLTEGRYVHAYESSIVKTVVIKNAHPYVPFQASSTIQKEMLSVCICKIKVCNWALVTGVACK
jgi:hypothetical protein